MLAALDDLQAKGVDEELVGIGSIINEVHNSVVGDDACGLFDGLKVILRDGSNGLVYRDRQKGLGKMRNRGH